MLTPKLEELIWCGKASFKTFVAGGSQGNTLLIEKERFIIITDITYFNSGSFPENNEAENNTWTNLQQQGMNTQLTVLGERGINRFLFRNSFVSVNNNEKQHLSPIGHTLINTYLLHTTEVGFAFSYAQDMVGNVNALLSADTFSLSSPTDYGRGGLTGAIAVSERMNPNGTAVYEDNFNGKINTPGVNTSNELSFPVDTTNNIPDTNRLNSWAYPICHVNYVEILGLPNNIGLY